MRARFVDAAMADRQGGSASTAVKHWLRFCVYGRHISPIRHTERHDPLAKKLAEEALLMDFVLWLVMSKPTGRSISIETAFKYVSTVKQWHLRKFGTAIAADLELTHLRDMLKGMRRELGQPPRRMRYGVRTQHLAEALRRFHPLEERAVDSKGYLNSLNWRAALTTTFCGLMRAAEAALQPGEKWHPELHLSRADVTFHRTPDGERYAVVMMRPVKNGRTMRGKTVPLTLSGGGTILDPVVELERLITQDPVSKHLQASTPLFRLRGVGGTAALTVDKIRKEIKQLMAMLGLDPARFGAHSLRIGGATAAAAADVPPSVIRCCGRWNSDIFEIYTRLTHQAAARMTRVIGSTAFDDLERGEFHTEELELLPSELCDPPEFEDFEFEDEEEA